MDDTVERGRFANLCCGHAACQREAQDAARRAYQQDVPYPLEGWVALKSGDHRADAVRGGCTCGFAVWSAEHVAIMAYREAVDCAPRVRDIPSDARR